jgi:hypothetical protein
VYAKKVIEAPVKKFQSNQAYSILYSALCSDAYLAYDGSSTKSTIPVYINAKIEMTLICLKPLISLMRDIGNNTSSAVGPHYNALYYHDL